MMMTIKTMITIILMVTCTVCVCDDRRSWLGRVSIMMVMIMLLMILNKVMIVMIVMINDHDDCFV